MSIVMFVYYQKPVISLLSLLIIPTPETLRSVHTKRQVAATRWGDTSQRQIASCVLENLEKMYVAATEFCRRNKSHRFSLIWFFATCGSDKIPLRRQRFSQNSPVHTKRFVAATCRLTVLLQFVARSAHMEWSVAATRCCNLSPSVYHRP